MCVLGVARGSRLPLKASNSEVKFYSKLNLARIIRVIAGRTNLAEVRGVQEVQVCRN
jgi:hypothetical protein